MNRAKRRATRHRPMWLVLFGAALVVLAAGCDRGPKRHHVSGRILHDGKPVAAGEIYFDPDVTEGHDGPQWFARIRNGQYDTREVGKSLVAGPHMVRILGFDGKGRPDEELPLGTPLFPEYKTPADVPDRDATLDFQIPARGKAR